MGEQVGPIRLSDFTDVSALYIMSDIRGFSVWSRKNQPEIRKLTKILYSLALELFGRRTAETRNRRVVKVLGDGFFAVSEYDDESDDSFLQRLTDTVGAIRSFLRVFDRAIAASNLHDRGDIKVSFGVSYGNSFRFHLPGQPLDYIGEKVNFSARLCSIAAPSEIVVEHDLAERLRSLPRVAPGLVLTDDQVELKSYGKTRVCRATDSAPTGPVLDEPSQVADFIEMIRATEN
jgi:class 3 adenylate cyclase